MTNQFGISTLFAGMAGAALVFALLGWAGDWASAFLISSWGIGTSVGVLFSGRFSKSIIPGSLIGGVVGTLIGYAIGQGILLRSRMLQGMSVQEILMFVGFSMCGSAVFAALVGVVQGGIAATKRHVEPNQHEQLS